jgi:hypothetical protein
MLLSPPRIAATLTSLGETEASSAGEQLAKGYPSRAVTDLRRGRLPGLPAPYPACAPIPRRITQPLLFVYASKNSRRRPNDWPERRGRRGGNNLRKNVARIPGTRNSQAGQSRASPAGDSHGS